MKMSIGRQLSGGSTVALGCRQSSPLLTVVVAVCVCVRACVSLLVGRLVMVAVGEVAV